MDLQQTIRELRIERDRLDESIRSLEQLQKIGVPRKGRGRRSMPDAERQIVSDRMRRYWAARKAGLVDQARIA